MSVKATELRKGLVIVKDGDLHVITDYEHKTPGNWRAIILIKTRSLKTGGTTQMRLGSSDMLEVAYLEKRSAEYLYRESDGSYVFMDSKNYEQFHVGADLISEKMAYVRANTPVEVTFHETTPIGVELPSSVVLKVVQAEAAVKGNTATGVKKEATLETGLTIKVPLHIEAGEEVKVNTSTGEFLGRAN